MNEEEINKKLTQILSDCQLHLEGIITISDTISEKSTTINELFEKVNDLKALSEGNNGSINTLLTESQTLKTQIDEYVNKANEQLNTLQNKYKELDKIYIDFVYTTYEAGPSKLEKINSAYNKVIETGDNTEKINTKIKEAETSIFGNKEANIQGIKDLIDSYESDIKQKKEGWEENYKTLFNKIEGLLPGATSTGLSKAYQDQGNKYKTPYIIWSLAFVAVTGGMIWFAISTLTEAKDISDAFIKILAKAPFFVPAIWLAIFTSKQQSQNRRLQEEYAYKETISKSYESYKREIEKLPDGNEKNQILNKLLETMVSMAGFNPSTTLQMKQHNDRPPLLSGILNKNKGKSES